MKYLLLLWLWISMLCQCSAQRHKSVVRGKMIYVKLREEVVDSIAIFSPRYSKQLFHGDNLFYTDGIVTPGRVTIKLFRFELGTREVTNAVLRSMNHDRERLLGIQLSAKTVKLRFRDEQGKRKVSYKIDSLLPESASASSTGFDILIFRLNRVCRFRQKKSLMPDDLRCSMAL
ncbi:MAG: hypothetical protein QM762_25460 [Chryseolinea sp.]